LYTVPGGVDFPLYLLRLEQLLAARCSAIEGVSPGFLHGEREIVDGNIQQCLAAPGSVGVRILLAQTLSALKRVHPEILPEFKDKLALLQKEHPLPEPACGVVRRIFDEVSVKESVRRWRSGPTALQSTRITAGSGIWRDAGLGVRRFFHSFRASRPNSPVEPDDQGFRSPAAPAQW
jgi:hypothetical protein